MQPGKQELTTGQEDAENLKKYGKTRYKKRNCWKKCEWFAKTSKLLEKLEKCQENNSNIKISTNEQKTTVDLLQTALQNRKKCSIKDWKRKSRKSIKINAGELKG